MRKQSVKADIVNNVKQFLLNVGTQIYDTGKRLYYVDYNNKPKKLTRV